MISQNISSVVKKVIDMWSVLLKLHWSSIWCFSLRGFPEQLWAQILVSEIVSCCGERLVVRCWNKLADIKVIAAPVSMRALVDMRFGKWSSTQGKLLMEVIGIFVQLCGADSMGGLLVMLVRLFTLHVLAHCLSLQILMIC